MTRELLASYNPPASRDPFYLLRIFAPNPTSLSAARIATRINLPPVKTQVGAYIRLPF